MPTEETQLDIYLDLYPYRNRDGSIGTALTEIPFSFGERPVRLEAGVGFSFLL